jgi:hypothetical protein
MIAILGELALPPPGISWALYGWEDAAFEHGRAI